MRCGDTAERFLAVGEKCLSNILVVVRTGSVEIRGAVGVSYRRYRCDLGMPSHLWGHAYIVVCV